MRRRAAATSKFAPRPAGTFPTVQVVSRVHAQKNRRGPHGLLGPRRLTFNEPAARSLLFTQSPLITAHHTAGLSSSNDLGMYERDRRGTSFPRFTETTGQRSRRSLCRERHQAGRLALQGANERRLADLCPVGYLVDSAFLAPFLAFLFFLSFFWLLLPLPMRWLHRLAE